MILVGTKHSEENGMNRTALGEKWGEYFLSITPIRDP